MRIILSDAGKRFNRDWIFRHLHYEFTAGQSYAITGPNGSGKSTLLQVLSGAMQLSEGTIQYAVTGNVSSFIAYEKVYRHISICAPYLEVVEEMTLKEFLHFHQQFKSFIPGLSVNAVMDMLGLADAANKQMRFFSSGMKQRVKLAQCIFSDTPVVLLDEPCTNLDAAGISLYHQLIHDYCAERLVIVSSNDEVEYNFCNHFIRVADFK